MPAAYVIAQVDVFDPENFAPYRTGAPESIRRYGGEYIVRGGAFEKLEGDDPLPRQVVIRFPDLKAARTWYASDAYKEFHELRLRCARTNMVLVEGLE